MKKKKQKKLLSTLSDWMDLSEKSNMSIEASGPVSRAIWEKQVSKTKGKKYKPGCKMTALDDAILIAAGYKLVHDVKPTAAAIKMNKPAVVVKLENKDPIVILNSDEEDKKKEEDIDMNDFPKFDACSSGMKDSSPRPTIVNEFKRAYIGVVNKPKRAR